MYKYGIFLSNPTIVLRLCCVVVSLGLWQYWSIQPGGWDIWLKYHCLLYCQPQIKPQLNTLPPYIQHSHTSIHHSAGLVGCKGKACSMDIYLCITCPGDKCPSFNTSCYGFGLDQLLMEVTKRRVKRATIWVTWGSQNIRSPLETQNFGKG